LREIYARWEICKVSSGINMSRDIERDWFNISYKRVKSYD